MTFEEWWADLYGDDLNPEYNGAISLWAKTADAYAAGVASQQAEIGKLGALASAAMAKAANRGLEFADAKAEIEEGRESEAALIEHRNRLQAEIERLKVLGQEGYRRAAHYEAVVEAARALQRKYSIKRPKPWSGDDGQLKEMWDAIDTLRSALTALDAKP